VSDPSDAETRRVGGGGPLSGLGRAIRVLLLLAGIAALGIGLLVAFAPETEGVLRIDAAIDALGSDYVVLAVLGLLAGALALPLAAAQRVRGVSEATPPAVEGVLTATYPGASFDGDGGGRLRRFLSARSTDDRRRRLREAAIRATMRAEGCSRIDAERRVDEGAWTSDPVAAPYLSASGGGVSGALSASGIARDGDPADRTVDAILAKTEGERSAGGDGERAGTGDEDSAATIDRGSDRDANAGPNADWDAERDAGRASDRRSDQRSAAREGVQ